MRFDKRQQGCRRTEPRSALRCDALAFRADGRRSEVTVADMSLNGLKVVGDFFENDDEFRLVIPHRGDINARVRWACASTAGARFDADVELGDVVPPSDSYAHRRLRTYNYSSGRRFGTRGTTPR